MNKKCKVLVAFLILSLVTILGCSLFQNGITPCYINEDCANYADEPLKEALPYTTILDAKRIDYKMDYVYSLEQLEYSYLKDNLAYHLANAERFKQTIFSPEGPIGLLISGLSFGTLGALLIKRPQEKELERKLNGINNNK